MGSSEYSKPGEFQKDWLVDEVFVVTSVPDMQKPVQWHACGHVMQTAMRRAILPCHQATITGLDISVGIYLAEVNHRRQPDCKPYARSDHFPEPSSRRN